MYLHKTFYKRTKFYLSEQGWRNLEKLSSYKEKLINYLKLSFSVSLQIEKVCIHQ